MMPNGCKSKNLTLCKVATRLVNYSYNTILNYSIVYYACNCVLLFVL